MTNLAGTAESPILEFNLLLKPINKQSTRFSVNGHAYTASNKRKDKAVLQWALKQQLPANFDLLDEALRVEYIFFFNTKHTRKLSVKATKPDIDNVLKAVNDAMEGVVCTRDQHIVSATASKFYYLYNYMYIAIYPADGLLEYAEEMAKRFIKPPEEEALRLGLVKVGTNELN